MATVLQRQTRHRSVLGLSVVHTRYLSRILTFGWKNIILLAFCGGVLLGQTRVYYHHHNKTPSSLAEHTPDSFRYSHSSDPRFAKAQYDSFGFFHDIPNTEWEERKEQAHRRYRPVPPGPAWIDGVGNIADWIDRNEHPTLTCPQEEWIGPLEDGHKFVCDPHRLVSLSDCLVYSIGSNGEFGFEQDLTKWAPNCEVHIFDFGDYEAAMQQQSWSVGVGETTAKDNDDEQYKKQGNQEGNGGSVHYHRYGLAGRYSWLTNFWNSHEPTFSFPTIVRKLGHEGRTIDILKIDCEFCEWTAYRDILGMSNHISQILIETHEIAPPFFTDMHKAGYVLFHKEPNFLYRQGCEWSFLKMRSSFWNKA